jgi:DNA adenine methylase Dam
VPKKKKDTHPYKIHRKIPDPNWTPAEISNRKKRNSGKQTALKDEQLDLRAVSQVAPGEAQPFLKWVGGKAQLLGQFDKFFPKEINRYVEVFVGGGAVFFHLKHRFPHLHAFLRDNNEELINTYEAVKEFPLELMRSLDAHLKEFQRNREHYYYEARKKYNSREGKIVDRAALMVFLNKTCFNGLWRVNGRGEFNVPIGSHKNPALYDEENLMLASRSLQGVELATRDFRETLAENGSVLDRLASSRTRKSH